MIYSVGHVVPCWVPLESIHVSGPTQRALIHPLKIEIVEIEKSVLFSFNCIFNKNYTIIV